MIYLPNLAHAQITQLPLFPQENTVDKPVEIIKVCWINRQCFDACNSSYHVQTYTNFR